MSGPYRSSPPTMGSNTHHHRQQSGTPPVVVGFEESPHLTMRLLSDALVGYEVAARAQSQANHHHHQIGWISSPSIELREQLNVFREFAGYVDSHYPSGVVANPRMGEARQTIQRLCPRVNNLSASGAATGSGGPGELDDDARNDAGLTSSLVSSPAPSDASLWGSDASLPGPYAADRADREGVEDVDADIDNIPSTQIEMTDGDGGDILGSGALTAEDEDEDEDNTSGGGAGGRRRRDRGGPVDYTVRRRSASPVSFWGSERPPSRRAGNGLKSWPLCPVCEHAMVMNWSSVSIFTCKICFI